jgi:hypothetical protein
MHNLQKETEETQQWLHAGGWCKNKKWGAFTLHSTPKSNAYHSLKMSLGLSNGGFFLIFLYTKTVTFL